jgi:DNA-binding winged helix-turn-helix (wHTH) protein/Tfp pilus assembly protein PilF
MSPDRARFYEFDSFRLYPVQRRLLKNGEPVQLAPKALETLLVLIESGGRVVDKSELISRLWPDTFVEEINLTVYISNLRKALGETPHEHRYIVTVPRRGYSFVAEIKECPAGGTPPTQAAFTSTESISSTTLPTTAEQPTRADIDLSSPYGPAHDRTRGRKSGPRVWIAAAALLLLLAGILARVAIHKERLPKGHTANPEAYHAYLKGMYFWNKRSEDSLRKSVEYLDQATQKDPVYALAYAGLSDSAALIAMNSDEPAERRRYFERARAAAGTAIQIDAGLAEAHTAMALIMVQYDRDIDGALREQRRALELEPGNATAHQRYGWYLFGSGQPERAELEMARAVELDPLSAINSTARANILYYLGRNEQAIREALKALDLEPNLDGAIYILGLAYEATRDYGSAVEQLERLRHPEDTNTQTLESLGHAYALSGRTRLARKIVLRLSRRADQDPGAMYGLALVYLGLGDKEAAFVWLNKAARARADSDIRFRFDPRLATLREDQRFQQFLLLRESASRN